MVIAHHVSAQVTGGFFWFSRPGSAAKRPRQSPIAQRAGSLATQVPPTRNSRATALPLLRRKPRRDKLPRTAGTTPPRGRAQPCVNGPNSARFTSQVQGLDRKHPVIIRAYSRHKSLSEVGGKNIPQNICWTYCLASKHSRLLCPFRHCFLGPLSCLSPNYHALVCSLGHGDRPRLLARGSSAPNLDTARGGTNARRLRFPRQTALDGGPWGFPYPHCGSRLGTSCPVQ